VYLPLLGFSLILSVALYYLHSVLAKRFSPKRGYVIVIILAAGFLIFSGVNTFLRNYVYSNEIALWEDSIEKSPGSYIPRLYLGYKYLESGQTNMAVRELKRALKIEPENLMGRIYLGLAYQMGNDYKRAISEYLRVLKKKPLDFYGNQNLGYVYSELKKYDKARFHLANVCDNYETAWLACRELGKVYLDLEEIDNAGKYLTRAMRINPYDSVSLKYLGIIFADHLDDKKKGLEFFKRSLSVDPNQPDLRKRLKK